jgi:ureidoglycolate lyase
MLKPEPLTKARFAPFGDVVEIEGTEPLVINQGFARRFDDLAGIDVAAEGGSAKVSLFTATPLPLPITINMMERHPLGSQLFFPLQNRPWLVVVCSDPDQQESFRVFAATATQGVNYRRNTWHFPLLVFDAESRFIVVDRIGPGQNLVEQMLAAPLLVPFFPHTLAPPQDLHYPQPP